MCHKKIFAALSMIAAISPAIAAQPAQFPRESAPPAPADARYCLRVEPITGTRVEAVRCKTREDWSLLGVDVDKDWAEEGVQVIS